MTDFETVQLIYFIDKEYGIVIGIGLFDDNKLETFKTEHLTKVFDSAWGEIVCTVIDQFGLIWDFFFLILINQRYSDKKLFVH